MPDLIQSTHQRDTVRAFFYGLLDAGWQTFAFIVAIRYFEASESFKSIIAASGPIGFLLTPLSLYCFARFRLTASHACTLIYMATALLLLGASQSTGLLLFIGCIVLSQIINVQQGPVMLQIFTTNYPSHNRAHYMKRPFILSAVSAIAFGFIGGKILDNNILDYSLLFFCMALASGIAGFAVYKIPSQIFSRAHIGNPWESLSLIWKDRLFGSMLGAWMLLGIGNLICLPIRYEYLANPKFGIDMNNAEIAMVMVAIPALSKILSTYIWANFFDQLKLMTTRNLLNAFFFLSVLLFFISDHIILIALASACQGIAIGGGKIFWNLWVTKIAKPEKVSSYMSIHMALTGVRGSVAPFIGYWILNQSSPQVVAYIGAVLIAISMILFECFRFHPRLTNKQPLSNDAN